MGYRFLVYSVLLHAAVALVFSWAVFRRRTPGAGPLPPVEVTMTGPTAPAAKKAPSVPSRPHPVTHEAASPAELAEKRVPVESAPAAPAAGGGGASNGAAADGFRSQLWAAIESQKEYPALARARHQTGRVLVGFTLKKDGRLTDIRIAAPCEYVLLNQAALDTLARLDHFQPIPDTVASGDLAFTVPLVFRLQN